MRVLLIHNAYQQPGGEDTVVEQERRLLESAGHRVITYLRSNCEMENSSASRKLTSIGKAFWATDSRRDIFRILQQEKPSVVHVHNTFFMISPSIYSACNESGVPVVQTLHNYRMLCPAANFFRAERACEECAERGLWRGVLHGCYRDSRAATAAVGMMLGLHRALGTWTAGVDCYIALSNFAREKFIAGGIPQRKIVVKPNFVSPDPGPGKGNREYALFVGRLSAEKGPGTLLDAWERLQSDIPLVMIGDGPLSAELKSRAQKLRLSHRITFLGRLAREETIAAMQRARFLILPSRCYENFPMSICEAFACGTPVICSRMGSMQEIVEDGRTGFHFSPGDADDLAGKVEWAWANPRRLAGMAAEARAAFVSKYTAERNYQMLMEIYRQSMTPSLPLLDSARDEHFSSPALCSKTESPTTVV
ncbi:MAG: glycosyltransferase family 4 protein [Candidatus Acidiferrales bacterium]